MQITIRSTEQIVDCGGVQCRLWDGKIDGGGPCAVFVHRIAMEAPSGELLPQQAPGNVEQLTPALGESVTRQLLSMHVQFVMAISKLLTGDEHFAAQVEEQGGDGLQELFDRIRNLEGASVSRTDAG